MSLLSLLLSHLLAAYTVLVEPILGVRLYADLERKAEHGGRARVRFYWLGLIMEWAWMAVVGLIVALGTVSLDDLGLRFTVPPGEVLGFMAAVALGSLVPVAMFWLRSLRSGAPGVRESFERMLEPVGALLPRTAGQRWLFAAVSITAGICEEVLFRGFLLFYLQDVFPVVGLVAAVVLSSAIFGLAHLYQGIKGVLGTGVFGAAMAALYVFSGSLLLPIVAHALLDLRILLLYRPAVSRGA